MSNQQQELLKQAREALITAYGAFLRIDDLAEVLKTSRESLQNTLRTSREPNIRYLLANRRRFGRRVYFAAAVVAEVLILTMDQIQRRLDSISATG